ncbi:type IX secretion system membrane protein PorP/SprF [Prolixibacteraceae bacterium JC049]|nr:type IX secretion system membrane protein PorP/SprF [Prolixibacteraceae bacterium JC049]
MKRVVPERKYCLLLLPDLQGIISAEKMRMKRIFSFLFLFIIINLAATAQQDPQFSQNMFNHANINPGAVGAGEAVDISLISRIQWAGFPGAPKTNIFGANAPFSLWGAQHGAGVEFMSDQWGYFENVNVKLSYALRKEVGNGNLGVGFSLNFFNWAIDPSNKNGELFLPASDVAIPSSKVSKMVTDIGFGVFYKDRNFYAGASVSHINRPAVKSQDGQSEMFFFERHYYLTAGYNIQMASPLFELKPSIFLKSDPTGVRGGQIDLNTNIVYDKKHWGGISYRLNEGFVLLLGTELANGLRLGYAFDITTSKLTAGTYGSHEFHIGYSIALQKKRKRKYKSIRYL